METIWAGPTLATSINNDYSAPEISDFIVPGDTVTFALCTNLAGLGGGDAATAIFSNTTQNTAFLHKVTAPSGLRSVGRTAAWIVGHKGSITSTFPDYGATFFFDTVGYGNFVGWEGPVSFETDISSATLLTMNAPPSKSTAELNPDAVLVSTH